MKGLKTTRRSFLNKAALATTAIIAAPYVKTAHAAGALKLGLWDHWVPGANAVLQKECDAWGEANGVEISLDFITSSGKKDILTATAEARAKTGHDIFVQRTWNIAIHAKSLEPVDDVIGEIEGLYGAYTPVAKLLAFQDGAWRAIPAPIGSHSYPMVSRVDLFKKHAGIDLKALFPAEGPRDQAAIEDWNYDNFLGIAKKLHAGGNSFGNPIGPTSDSQDWLGPLFMSFGSTMVDADGDIVVDSDETRTALEYMKELTQYMPPEVYAWDDGSNNRWLISGRGSAIQNPPSAWAVCKRDNPDVAEQIWHHDTPRGPKGRFRGSLPYFWGLWNFAKNKSAAKDLLIHLADPKIVHKLINASQGYDMPMLPIYYETSKVWDWASPPAGTLHNYPVRGDEELIVTGFPAPALIAANIYNQSLIPNLVGRVTQGGEPIDKAIKWAENELEGFMRS